MTQKQQTIQEVFRPGKAEPNDMYVSRSHLEGELIESLDSDQISFLVGGSGSGKSWLYKKFFADHNVEFSVLTVSRAYTTPLRELMEKELARLDVTRTKKERHSAGFANLFGIFGASRETEREFRDEDVFILLARHLRLRAKSRPAYLVLENSEQGLSDQSGEFVNAVANMVLLANSDEFVKLRIRLLIVSADDELRTKLARMPNSDPIIRRLRPLPEVTSFSEDEAQGFLERGFEQKLGIKIDDMQTFMAECKDATDLRPDFMNEYCLIVAKEATRQRLPVNDRVIGEASAKWADTKLAPYIERIAAFMNKKDTKKRVRDKILYALAQRVTTKGFTSQNVLDIIRAEFPSPTVTFQSNEITRELNILCNPEGENAALLHQFGTASNPLYGFVGALERVATAFLLKRVNDDIVRHHGLRE